MKYLAMHIPYLSTPTKRIECPIPCLAKASMYICTSARLYLREITFVYLSSTEYPQMRGNSAIKD